MTPGALPRQLMRDEEHGGNQQGQHIINSPISQQRPGYRRKRWQVQGSSPSCLPFVKRSTRWLTRTANCIAARFAWKRRWLSGEPIVRGDSVQTHLPPHTRRCPHSAKLPQSILNSREGAKLCRITASASTAQPLVMPPGIDGHGGGELTAGIERFLGGTYSISHGCCAHWRNRLRSAVDSRASRWTSRYNHGGMSLSAISFQLSCNFFTCCCVLY
jgi:hypothetical protein